MTRLCLFYKIVNGLVAVPLPHYIEPVVRPSRSNTMNFRQLHTGKDYYKYFFFPLAIVKWNALPEYVVVSPGPKSFKTAVGASASQTLNSEKHVFILILSKDLPYLILYIVITPSELFLFSPLFSNHLYKASLSFFYPFLVLQGPTHSHLAKMPMRASAI